MQLSVSGAATPTGLMTIATSGTPGLHVVLLVGTAPAEVCMNPFGPVFLSFASPWLAMPWGTIPSSIDAYIPASLPVPVSIVVQEIALTDSRAEGNTSNSVELTIE